MSVTTFDRNLFLSNNSDRLSSIIVSFELFVLFSNALFSKCLYFFQVLTLFELIKNNKIEINAHNFKKILKKY